MSSTYPRYRTDRIVNSVEEAVALASEWQVSGRCDWFRGQSKPWALTSTMSRLGEGGRGAGIERLNLFAQWLDKTEGLDSIRDDVNAAFAVAQHYGLPTDFIDFTSDLDVAAFFATHGKEQQEGEFACLICINSQEYIKTVNLHAEVQDTPKVKTVCIHVADLWRLQAQRGVFLDMPYANIEKFYPTERILFPFTSKWPRPPEDHVYPNQKSRLEFVLDHYFEVERLKQAHEDDLKWLESLQIQDREARMIKLRVPQGFLLDYVDARKVEDLAKWSSIEVEAWLRLPDERWEEVKGYEKVSISLPPKNAGFEDALFATIMASIGSHRDLRCKLCQFQLLDPHEIFSLKDCKRLETLELRLWDGMRNLPYSLEQIGRTLTKTLLLELTIDRHRLYNGREWYGVFESVIPDLQKVGLSMPDGSGGYAFLPKPVFYKGLRPEISDILLPNCKSFIDEPKQLLQVITNPEILFDFDSLVEMFANYLIPTQAVVYGLNQPLLINPASLMIFGAP